jgi:site-specific recombinase XerD
MQGNKRCKKQTDFVNVLTALYISCITTERIKWLSERSLQVIETQLELFIVYVRLKNISSFDKFTPEFIKDYVISANISGSSDQGKMIIRAIRKFFSFLKLRQYITQDPAAYIPHPKEHPRQQLPLYLKPDDLYRLLDILLNTDLLFYFFQIEELNYQ